jgi:GntP family gluconate:H+ symporter
MTLILLVFSVILMVMLTTRFNVHPFLALLAASVIYAVLSGMPLPMIIESVNRGFGTTLGQIGLVIVFGVIIGSFLEHSGAAYKLAEAVLRIIGRKRVYEAMGLVGFIISIPVFADSGFIILNPLNKSISKKAGLSIAGTASVLMLGLLISHVLVPPTPGPIAAAGILKADVGLVMLIGILIGLPTLAVAIFISRKIFSRIYIDPSPEISDKEIKEKIEKAPGVLKSFLPILLPIILIVSRSVMDFKLETLENQGFFVQIVSFLGTPVIALALGVVVSLTLPDKLDRRILSSSGWVGKSLGSASSILLITGAGGILGMILQNSGIAETITGLMGNVQLGIWLPFLLCAAIKTAQGSSTVALITTASIMAPLLSSMGFDTEIQKALVVGAIGAGAAVVSHVNDSGFWIMTQFSGMDVKAGYRTYTLGSLIVGTTAALLIFIMSLFL